ncbi:hypothetical protein NFX46_01965 [Streptomyces phaeoluteigriseus]|uniref:HNH endonuclease n=1 Tax=Streptomyces phaeoluteigriseus TaxID=114686 RepID=A0ABY4Z168_9ACTN|nr:hypothetical protein [Streptomyces phaeoluteigriseus]USQ82641.1 hypothetical protein NFX46_01965 [Streptomyces phaeoluteigriseus]
MAITPEEAEGREAAERRTRGLDWSKGHRLHIHNQIESRPGPIEADGASWLENRATGMVHLACNCGYSSGWIPRREMPDPMHLKAEHGAPIESQTI